MSDRPSYDFNIIYVSNLEESLAYFEKLGFLHLTSEDAPGYRQLRGGEGSIDFGLVQANEQTPPAGTIQLYYKIADLEGARAEIVSRGVEASPIRQMPFGTVFSLKSPDGHLLSMMAG